MNAGEIVAGKYRVLRELGQGGMGLVVLAEHVHLGEHVALKVMTRADPSSDASQRFLREARAAAKLKGEHIARATDFGLLDSGAAYIVLEYLEGEDLGAHLRRTGRVITPEAVGYVLQACEGIAEAHASGIVHRDLKPSNLFLTRRPDGSALVKVLDFGVAKSSQPNASGGGASLGLTNTGVMMGSPIYMSPEQLKSAKDVGPASDVWALCVVLFELLTGRQPFGGETFPAIAGAILYVPSPDPCADRKAIPRPLGDVVLKGLAKNPADRFASVGELARALAPFANEEAHVHAVRASRILREAELPARDSFASQPQFPPASGTSSGSGPQQVVGSVTPALSATPQPGIRNLTPPAFSPYGPPPTPMGQSEALRGGAAPLHHGHMHGQPSAPMGGAPFGPTTTAGYMNAPTAAAPASARSPLPYVLGGLAVLFVVAGVGLAATRFSRGSAGPAPSSSAPPSSTHGDAPAALASAPSASASTAAPASPSASATPSPAAAKLPQKGAGKATIPPPAASPPATPASAPAAVVPTPPPSPPKPDCSNPVVTDPATGEVRVKPGCR